MKGVNLGGWLILEKWMTPSLFEGRTASNEFELSITTSGKSAIAKHHKTFITESDMDWLKQHDIEIVRIPVGYWIFGDDDRYVGSIERLDWVLSAAKERNIRVLIDLHAAPESQNNYEHSGSGNRPGRADWLKNSPAQKQTIEVLVKLAARYADNNMLWGIELLNEPHPGIFGLRLAQFYRRAYKSIRPVARKGMYTIFSDGYAPVRLTNSIGLLKSKDHPVAMDMHIYQCFSDTDKNRPFKKQIARLRTVRRFLRAMQLFQPVIVGEFSGMLPYKVNETDTRDYIEAQYSAYKDCLAYFYWNYKTENRGRWNYRDMAD